MKKVLCIITIIAVLVCFVGCYDGTSMEESDNSNIEFWTDTETGVQYVIYDRQDRYGGMGGITPRLNADGTLYTTY